MLSQPAVGIRYQLVVRLNCANMYAFALHLRHTKYAPARVLFTRPLPRHTHSMVMQEPNWVKLDLAHPQQSPYWMCPNVQTENTPQRTLLYYIGRLQEHQQRCQKQPSNPQRFHGRIHGTRIWRQLKGVSKRCASQICCRMCFARLMW